MELTFNDVQFDVINRNNQPWVRGYQIGTALGYGENADISIRKLYTRHADEFNDAMTAVITLPTEGGPQDTRIFSLRGCHLLAMFARTPVAKAFRKWVLDVLDMLAASNHSTPQPADGPLTPALRAELKAIVDAKLSTAPADVQGKARAEIWTRFNRHFKIAEYAQLPACRMPEARDYLIEMQMKSYPTKTAAAVPANAEHEIETHCAAMRGLVRQLNAHMDEIFNIARKSRPDLRTPGDRRELALASIYSMEDAAGAIGHNIAVLERTAKTTLIAARM